MKKFISLMLVLMVICICSISTAFAIPTGTSLDEVISSQQESNQSVDDKLTEDKDIGTYEKNKDFIDGLHEAGDLSTADVEGAKKVTEGIKYVAAWLVQVISYTTIVLLSVRIVLDLAYIGLPFARGLLSNGFQGNAQAGAGGVPNNIGGQMGGIEPIGMQSNMASTDTRRKVQLVSNAALNVVAGESSGGQVVSSFKLYAKDMLVVLVIVPVLITLAVTGVLTNLGFVIGSLLMDLINSLGNMI